MSPNDPLTSSGDIAGEPCTEAIRLVYLRIGSEGASEPKVIARGHDIGLTPRAGGALLAPDGKMILSFERDRGEDGAYGEVAMGR